ncbi:hypothetical protein K7X08_008409 [Anisodus acutangulus]|uniref:Uncharacterized protein n=1 Tax=Anisodus acutangulus TaxID=402998 RepID=A0A9Q1MR22_9SOLA|nr:hypothetical protein K7X08_008409 [Anisodus acutangulus]
MIPRPDCLDNLMKVVRSIGPTVIVVGEVEANHNSPSFLNRFIETLFFYGTFFDCFEDCMERGSPCRTTIEGVYFGEGIRNIVAAEGEDRFTRNVKLEVWRAFFASFSMMEEELSESAWYQANLILKQLAQGSSCDLQKDGKGLIIGWKGTPIHSQSIWKFLSRNTEGDRVGDTSNGDNVYQKLTAMQIMKLAGERFIQFSSNKFININNLLHPYGSALLDLSPEDNQDVELVQILLAAAEKVSDQQYDRARKFLSQCQPLASNTGNPVQRVVSYFAQALGERIDRETGKLMPRISAQTDELNNICIESRFHVSFVALHQEVPFTQVVHFTGIQAILECVATKPKVHLIDFLIRTGVQWASLIQAAAAERKDTPIEHMKITSYRISR